MTLQQRADAYLAAWQLLRHLPPLLRMALIETLCEIERAQVDPNFGRRGLVPGLLDRDATFGRR